MKDIYVYWLLRGNIIVSGPYGDITAAIIAKTKLSPPIIPLISIGRSMIEMEVLD